MANQKSKIAKVFIFITLIAIVFASFAIYIVMYAWFNAQDNNPCNEWYIRNAETQECEEEIIENIVGLSNFDPSDTVISNERQLIALKKASEILEEIIKHGSTNFKIFPMRSVGV